MKTTDNPFLEFLDDYFAESDEHLGSLRSHLLGLESLLRAGSVGPGVSKLSELMDGMRHSLHSLKGLSAMVGIHDAEQLAHAMEESLREVEHAASGPTSDLVEALVIGTGNIERVIAEWKKREVGPQTDVVSAVPQPSVVRVDMRRLDHLMTMLGDLVISRVRVEASLRRLEAILPVSEWRELQDANMLLQRQLRDLRKGVMSVRMVPIGQVFERMRFVIRGLERESQKDVRLEVTGEDTQIDKLLVERMIDPLLHMVRNAVSHGLESSEERAASGKTREGHLRLHASAEAETIVIELEDDGRGVNVKEIASRAHRLGLLESGETVEQELKNSRVLQLICAPGFSSREEADLGSGRGVGMTIVKATVNGLGGSLTMTGNPGQGTRFTIRLPLTLAVMEALIVELDDQQFAVPRSLIHEVLRVETSVVSKADNSDVIPYRGKLLPIVHLRRLFRMNEKSLHSFHVVVAGSDSNAIGIAVDRIAGQREIVARSTEDSLIRVPGIAGATEIGDGRPVLILDVAVIVDAACNRRDLVPEMRVAS